MAAIEPQLGALAGRLASVGPRGRAGAAAGALLRTIVRGARAPALRSAMPRLATAIAAQIARAPNLVGLLARRMPAQEIVQLLLDPALQHWKSSKVICSRKKVFFHVVINYNINFRTVDKISTKVLTVSKIYSIKIY